MVFDSRKKKEYQGRGGVKERDKKKQTGEKKKADWWQHKSIFKDLVHFGDGEVR